MNVFPVKIRRNGEDLTLTLKLDVKRIRELCEKHQKDIMDLITDVSTSPGTLADILDAALHHSHNENPVDLDGDELFDLLVEAGILKGMASWVELTNKIAVVSGVLEQEQSNAMIGSMKRRMKQLVDKLNSDAEETADPSQKVESKEQ